MIAGRGRGQKGETVEVGQEFEYAWEDTRSTEDDRANRGELKREREDQWGHFVLLLAMSTPVVINRAIGRWIVRFGGMVLSTRVRVGST